jgi:hypothetical protein
LRRAPAPGDQAEDLGDQRGVGGAVPGVALEQGGRGTPQEIPDRPFGLGQIERPLQGLLGRSLVAERVPDDRLQQERRDLPARPDEGSGTVQDRFQREGRGARVALGEPQRCGGNSDFPAFAVVFAESGEGLLGALGLVEADQVVQAQGLHPQDEVVRCGQGPGQLFSGLQGG